MRINIITAINNGAGLQVETQMLLRLFADMGHQPLAIDCYKPTTLREADLNIHMEILPGNFFYLAKNNWFVPNPEWYYPDYWDRNLSACQAVMCKTRAAVALFEQRHKNVKYLGWQSTDNRRPNVPKERKFLHVQGKSEAKNTLAVVGTWREFDIPAPLTVISAFAPKPHLPANVTWLPKMPEEDLKQMQNNHVFHLCPSQYEGFGLYLHEALSCGAVVVTTDSPPMNEFVGCPEALRVQPIAYFRKELGTMAVVDSLGIKKSVDKCLAYTKQEIAQISTAARACYEIDVIQFQTKLAKELAAIA